MKSKLLFSYRFLTFILSVLAFTLQLTKHGGFGMMLITPSFYPTCWFHKFREDTGFGRMVRGRSTQTRATLQAKGAVTVSIMTTCVIYHFVGAFLRRQRSLSFGKLPLSLHRSFDVLL